MFADRTPPNLSCPEGGAISVVAEPGKTDALVTWTDPVYGNDGKDGRIRYLSSISFVSLVHTSEPCIQRHVVTCSCMYADVDIASFFMKVSIA